MSDDEIVFKKYKHRIEKRKSAINSLPQNIKTLSSPKPNEKVNNLNNNFSKSGQKINQNNMLNNNYLNNNFILNNNNNWRRNSHHINQLQNALFFNNILRESQSNAFNRYACPLKTIKDNINSNINNNNIINSNSMNNNNFIQNSTSNINNNNTNLNQMNFNQGFPNNNNFNNYNYMNNFVYNYNNNNINNNIKNPTNKKRNSMILLNASEVQMQRRSSQTSIPNIQFINSDKALKKIAPYVLIVCSYLLYHIQKPCQPLISKRLSRINISMSLQKVAYIAN
jgi:hypothetical protein